MFLLGSCVNWSWCANQRYGHWSTGTATIYRYSIPVVVATGWSRDSQALWYPPGCFPYTVKDAASSPLCVDAGGVQPMWSCILPFVCGCGRGSVKVMLHPPLCVWMQEGFSQEWGWSILSISKWTVLIPHSFLPGFSTMTWLLLHRVPNFSLKATLSLLLPQPSSKSCSHLTSSVA